VSDFPTSGVTLVADTDQYTSAMQEALDLASQFDSLGDLTVSLSVDDSGVQDVQGSLDDLDNTDVTPSVTPSLDDTDILPFEDLDGADIEPTVTPQVTPQSMDILTKIHDIADIAAHAWNLTVNVAGTALDFLNAVNNFTVQPMLDLDDAVAKFNAQTGTALPNARELFQNILFSDLGTSAGQISDVAIAAQSLNAPIDEATRAALEFTHTFKDQDPTQVLKTLNTLVETGLAPSFTDASNLLTTFFQEGGNKGKDAIATINTYAQSWADMGLSGTESLSLVNSLLKGNVDNASDAARGIQTLDDSLTTAAQNANSPQAAAIGTLGIVNPKELGEQTGADFFNSFATKFSQLSDTQQDEVGGALAGKVGKRFTGALGNMSTESIGPFSDLTDAAATAAQTIDDSLRGAIDDFTLAAQQAATDFLSSKQIDLPGKIAALKTGIQDALSALQSGDTLGQALTIGLKPIGLDEPLKKLEQLFDTLVISLLQIVASIQDLTGHGDQATATRATITSVALDRLTLALEQSKTDADQVAAFSDAISAGGLTDQGISDALHGAVKDLLAEGNIAGAQGLANSTTGTLQADLQMLVDTMKEQQAESARATAFKQTNDATLGAQSANMALTHGGDQIQDVTNKASVLTTNLTDWSPKLDDANMKVATLTTSSDTLNQSIDTTNQALADMVTPTGDIAVAADSATGSLIPLNDNITLMATNTPAAVTAVDNLNAAIQGIIDKAGSASATAAPGTSQKMDVGTGHAAGTSNASGTFMVGEQGPEIVTSNRALAVLNHQTTAAIMAALSGYIPGASSVSRAGGNVNSVTNNNYVQSQAQADALGYRTGEVLRGMA
jgi:hypothetical protein